MDAVLIDVQLLEERLIEEAAHLGASRKVGALTVDQQIERRRQVTLYRRQVAIDSRQPRFDGSELLGNAVLFHFE
ncbi:hypothetical protein [Kineococcus glutinatus]|uniref:hypothetical protein n=1 Tax=Kineococcus glutinatus TaxID=1070872 RepID=UPI0031ED9108